MTPAGLSGVLVLVTGGHGFLGAAVVHELRRVGASVLAPTHAELELRDPAAVARELLELHPAIVVHLAARVGGIGANQRRPGTFWHDNLLMGLNVLEASRTSGVARLVAWFRSSAWAIPVRP